VHNPAGPDVFWGAFVSGAGTEDVALHGHLSKWKEKFRRDRSRADQRRHPHRPRIVGYMQLQQQQCRQHRSHCGARQFSILTSPTGAHTTTLHYATSLAPPFTSNIIIIIIIIVFAQ